MKKNRLERINSLLKEIISDVIHREVKNPHLHAFITVTTVETTADLTQAKVSISITSCKGKLATQAEKEQTLTVLQSAANFIAVQASKQADLRYFPHLTFKLDKGLQEQIRIEELLAKIEKDRIENPPQITDDE